MPQVEISAVAGNASLLNASGFSELALTSGYERGRGDLPSLSFGVQLGADVWDPSIGVTDSQASRELISALVSSQDEAAGWDAIVQPALVTAEPSMVLTQVDETMLDLRLPHMASGAYTPSSAEEQAWLDAVRPQLKW